MKSRTLVFSCLLALCAAGTAQAVLIEPADPSQDSLAARASAKAETITSSKALLTEITTSLQLARDGDYGKLKRNAISKLEGVREDVERLLDGHESARELGLEDQIELYNALEVFTSTLGNDDKNRVVCRREVALGSRLPVTECLTVAQREERARVARDSAGRALRNACTEGNEGSSPCTIMNRNGINGQ